ncbi:MAG TPA: tRNA lysidine(34) synthetase TilS [Candidatus Babeliales bacterium]|nr:tRNA lysidine(34) synthetase TilS [Candidatus Babeliales bacterium]
MLEQKHTNLITIPDKSTVIIGLSGGPDSVLLLHLLAAAQSSKQLNLIAAHLDHQWRSDSDKDVTFCQELCDSLGIPLITTQASKITLSGKPSGSQEDLGRQLRRTFFEQLAKEHNANAIALAHHFNDQMETFFIRMVRGTTLTGLTGMKKRDGLYWRPLLNLSKQNILDRLDMNKLKYLIDPSNQSDKYLRNRIRNNVLPTLKDCDSRFDVNFDRMLTQLQTTESFLEEVTQQAYEKVVSLDNVLDIKAFKQEKPFLQKRILLQWLYVNKVQFTISERFINEIMTFLSHERGGFHKMHTSWGIEKKQHKGSIRMM